MTRQKFGAEAQEALLKGAYEVFRAVSSTMGARGRNVVRQNFGQPKITNDGVTIANSINLEDPFERQGADLLKDAARTTVKEAGDGTTASIVLSYTGFEKGLNLIKSGMNPMMLRKLIEVEAEKVLKYLKEMSIPITNDEELESVASISIESKEQGKIVAHAVKTAGKDGLVVVEEDYKPGIFSEEVSGYQFDRGLEIPYLVGDRSNMTTTFPIKSENDKLVPILVADKSWNQIEDLLPLFEEIKASASTNEKEPEKCGGDKLVIIAEEISGKLAEFLVVNRMNTRFHAVVVKPPFNKDMLEDIATLTGATAITNLKGVVNIKKSHLGWAKKVIVTEENTTIIGGLGDNTQLIEDLRSQLSDDTMLEHIRSKLQERLAKLTGKTIILKVGAETEAESRYLKDKLDDAVAATKAALEEGIVPGGGMALARIGENLYDLNSDSSEVAIFMKQLLRAPVDKILENAGETNESKVNEILSRSETSGYDAVSGHIVNDIVAHGIIDPTKVVRCAFKNAVSLACILMTIDAVIAEMPEK